MIPPRDHLKYLMPFGKYKDQTLQQIGESDPLYLDWLAGLDNLREPLLSAVTAAHRHFEQDIQLAIDVQDDDRGHTPYGLWEDLH